MAKYLPMVGIAPGMFVCMSSLYKTVGVWTGAAIASPQLIGGPASLLPAEFAGPVLITVGWAGLYYGFLFYQSMTKFAVLAKLKAEAKKTDGKVPSLVQVKYGSAGSKHGTLAVDRTTGNMLEQSPPFLVALWLCAATAGPISATKLGWIWLVSRAVYPWAFRNGPTLFLSTIPGYAAIYLMLWLSVCDLLF